MERDNKKFISDLLEDLADEDYIDYENDDDELDIERGIEKVEAEEAEVENENEGAQEEISVWLDSIKNLSPLQTFDVEIEALDKLKLDLEKAQWEAGKSNPAKEWSDEDIQIQVESQRQKRFDHAVKLYESRADKTLTEGYDDYALSYASCLSNLPIRKIKELIDTKRGSRN